MNSYRVTFIHSKSQRVDQLEDFVQSMSFIIIRASNDKDAINQAKNHLSIRFIKIDDYIVDSRIIQII